MTARRILVTGSRRWADRHTVEFEIREHALDFLKDIDATITVVHGGASGADACAAVAAKALGFIRVEEHPANWGTCTDACTHTPARGARYCPEAGPRRNQHMVDLGADICLAFVLPDSRGTWDCVRRCEKAGIPVRIIKAHLEEDR